MNVEIYNDDGENDLLKKHCRNDTELDKWIEDERNEVDNLESRLTMKKECWTSE